MEAVALKLMHVVFRFFQAFARQNALAVSVNLQHVFFGLLPVPAKYDLENMRHVVHVIDRVIPADYQIPRLQRVLCVGFGLLFSCRQNDWLNRFRHTCNIEA